MFNKNQLAGLMKQAQAMQSNMKKAQDELAQLEVTGEAGSGAVKITITGKHQVRRVQLDESLLEILRPLVGQQVEICHAKGCWAAGKVPA